MTAFIYPESWSELRQSPLARWELIQYVSDVARWNSENSPIRAKGADSLIGFLLDDYRMNEGVTGLVGELIFSDELIYLMRFATEFDLFVAKERSGDRYLSRLHEASAPESLISSARQLAEKLKERGMPRSA